jgi:hypothetical protein
VEATLDDLDVDDLYADVSVQTGSDGTGERGEDVPDGLPAVLADAVVCESEGELSLEGVDVLGKEGESVTEAVAK